jgi:hypothetical protein
MQHPDKLTTARFLSSLLIDVFAERLAGPTRLFQIFDHVPLVPTEPFSVSQTEFIRIWRTGYIEGYGLRSCCDNNLAASVLEAIHTRVPYLAGTDSRFVKRHYRNHPLTLDEVDNTLLRLHEKKLTRNFVKTWCNKARYKTDYYFLYPGKVGNGNRTFVLLTVGGFFDMLHSRSRSRKNLDMLYKAHKHAQELQSELNVSSLIETRMVQFVPTASRRPILSYML